MFNEFWSILENVTGRELNARSEIENRYASAKSKLIELLGGPVYEETIEIEPTPEDIEEIKNAFLENFSEEVANLFRDFFNQLTHEELRTGRISETKLGFCPGTKLGKVFLKYAKDSGLMEKIGQNEQQLNSVFSIFLQSIRAQKLTFRISAHPLDYLLISENTTGWRTCHSLDGIRRAGNLAYLLDSSTVVAYVYKGFSEFMGVNWPRKIWRQLVFIDVDNSVAIFQRQYPDRNKNFAATVRKIIEKLLAKYHHVENARWLLKENPLDPIEICSRLPYIDYAETRIRLDGVSPEVPPLIKVGARVPCPNCGKRSVLDPEGFLCADCGENGIIRCANCGLVVHEDDAMWYDGEPYCQDCWDDLFSYCDNCGENFPREYLKRGPDGNYYCESCFDELFAQCDNCREYVSRDDLWEGPDHHYYCEECFDALFSPCDICEEYHENADIIEYCGIRICRECFRNLFIIDIAQCDNCGCTVENEELIELDDGRKLCQNCAHKLGIRIPGVLA
jgi:hypothetical protein